MWPPRFVGVGVGPTKKEICTSVEYDFTFEAVTVGLNADFNNNVGSAVGRRVGGNDGSGDDLDVVIVGSDDGRGVERTTGDILGT